MLVAGPVMVVRLYRPSDGKVLYLFADYHQDLDDQTECDPTKRSVRVDQLLLRLFDHDQKRKIGFFLEFKDKHLESDGSFARIKNQIKFRTRSYVSTVTHLFRMNLLFDKKGKVVDSQRFPNVKFHFFDLRGLEYREEGDFHTSDKVIAGIKNFFVASWERLSRSRRYQKVVRSSVEGVRTEWAHCKAQVESFTKVCDARAKRAQSILQELWETRRLPWKQLIRKVSKVQRLVERTKWEAEDYRVVWTDLYLLRRLLEKDYGSKIDVVYTGVSHVLHVCLFLLKYTKYELKQSTHDLSFLVENVNRYSPRWFVKALEELETRVLGVDFSYTTTPTQCVDVSQFEELVELN